MHLISFEALFYRAIGLEPVRFDHGRSIATLSLFGLKLYDWTDNDGNDNNSKKG